MGCGGWPSWRRRVARSREATEAIGRRCGQVVGKRGVEQLTVAAAADIDAFSQAVVPQPATDDTVLVLSVDGKGVVMRPEALRAETRKAAAQKGVNRYRTRLASGEKQGRKRMATLGVVYDADPAPRRPHDVIGPVIALHAEGGDRDGAARQPRQGPVATAKWLVGSVATTSEHVISQVFDQAQQRDPTHRRTWVVLVDGARHQLELIRAEAARRGVPIHILVDLIHVLEYLWKAAWCFHHDADPAAEPWVAAHALKLLAGETDAVITALGQQATNAGLTAPQRGGVDACIGYLTAKRELLGYDTALQAGWPIATGVYRRRLPPPDRRPLGHQRRPLGPARRRGRPQAACPAEQRRLRRLLALPRAPRGATDSSGGERTPPLPCRSKTVKLRAAGPQGRAGRWEQP
jgi:hypothetical protein